MHDFHAVSGRLPEFFSRWAGSKTWLLCVMVVVFVPLLNGAPCKSSHLLLICSKLYYLIHVFKSSGLCFYMKCDPDYAWPVYKNRRERFLKGKQLI